MRSSSVYTAHSDAGKLGPPASGVWWDPADQAYVVARYATARDLLKSDNLLFGEVARMVERLSGRLDGGLANLSLLVGTSHPFQNEPAHAPARAWFRDALARLLQLWTHDRVSTWTEARLADLPDDATVDAVALLAEALPEAVVADAMNLPATEVHRIGALSRRTSELWSSRVHPTRELRLMEAAAAELVQLIGARAGTIGGVCAAPGGEPLAREHYARTVFLVSAGVETTAGALASGLDLLARYPALQAELRRQPDQLTAFADEVLRLHPPLRRNVARVATTKLDVDGVPIPKDGRVIIDIEKANRDPEAYERPDIVDLKRNGAPHLSFGGGAHACVGAPLAKVELRAAFEQMISSHEVRPAGEPTFRTARTFRQYQTLPLRLVRLAR